MRAVMKIDRPNDVHATMELTMTIGQWKIVSDALLKAPDGGVYCHVTGNFRAMLDSMVRQADDRFSEVREDER